MKKQLAEQGCVGYTCFSSINCAGIYYFYNKL
jgi:hypothetical protein